MKHLILLLSLALSASACGSNSTRSEDAGSAAIEAVQDTPSSAVNVYYFHGKQRCKTCVAVGEIAKSTITEGYADTPQVRYAEIQTEEKINRSLVEKYKVTWNALIIANGDEYVDVTKQAFANALRSPDALKELIRNEVDKRLGE